MARKAATNSQTTTHTIDLPAELQQRREELGLTPEELARLVACEAEDIRLIEHGEGQFEVMSRVMDKMKVDLTGIATGTLLHVRMRDTRLRKKRSLAALSTSTGLADRILVNLESGIGKVADFLTVLAALVPRAGIRGKGGAPGEKDTRFTPKTLLWSLCSVFGQIDWDTCGNQDSHLPEVAGNYLDRGGDGLTQPWGGTVVFMNPPFSGLSKWTDKFLAEALANPHKIHIALIPAVTESRFFRLIPEHGGEIF